MTKYSSLVTSRITFLEREVSWLERGGAASDITDDVMGHKRTLYHTISPLLEFKSALVNTKPIIKCTPTYLYCLAAAASGGSSLSLRRMSLSMRRNASA